jgi:hypothetical protein
MSGLNEHQAFQAYQTSGLAGLAGQTTEQQKALAKVLSLEVMRMDPNHPATDVVKRDIAQIYKNAHPVAQKASDADRAAAGQAIAQLKEHPAYLDPKHPQHQAVTKQIAAAYEVRYRGEGDPGEHVNG